MADISPRMYNVWIMSYGGTSSEKCCFFKVLPLLPHIFFCPLPAPCSEAASEYEKVLFRREESVAVAKIMEDVFLACWECLRRPLGSRREWKPRRTFRFLGSFKGVLWDGRAGCEWFLRRRYQANSRERAEGGSRKKRGKREREREGDNFFCRLEITRWLFPRPKICCFWD